MKNFLQDYVRLGEKTEVPEIFMFWCGLAGLSFSLGRAVWLDMGHYILYPNLYVVLVASSGRHRKSTAVGMMERLLRRLEPPLNIIAQKITPEALIEALRVVHTENDKEILRETCEGCIIADELATFLNKKSYETGLGSLLTTLFDCKDSFKYHTKSRGEELLQNSYLGLLSASTLDWVRQAIPLEAVGQGLTSRMCFVYVDTPPEPFGRTESSKEKKLLEDQLLAHLMGVSKLRGRFELTEEAWELFDETYNNFFRTSRFYEDYLMSGYASRRHTHLLKLGMLFSVAESTELVVTKKHLQYAKNLLEQSEPDLERVVRLIASTEQGLSTDMILRIIGKRGEISRSGLLQKVSHSVSSRDLTEIMATLVHAGLVRTEVRGGTIYYSLNA